MNKIRITIFTTVFVLLQSVHTHSFDLGTHRDLTERAILSSSLDNFLKTKLGLAGGINEAILNKRIRDRITEGSVREDDSPRFCNHFHNPLSNWGAAGLQIPIPTPIPIPQGCLGTINHSSVLWGQSPSLQTSNESFTWQDARTTYFEGLTAQNQSEREGKLSRTFRALGQLIHLVQDAAVPAHTRNDLHPLQSIGFLGLESFVENTRINDGDLFDQLTGSSQPFDRSILAAPPNRSAPIPIAHIIDLTDSDQLAAVPSAGTDQGMAEYSNANFLSNDTIFGRDFTFPREESLGSFFLGIEPLTLLPRIYFPKVFDGETVDHFVATSSLFELLLPFGRTDLGYVLDRRVLQDYAAKLLPRAIGYSAGLINYFFRGRISLTLPEDQPSGDPITEVVVNVKNVTPFEQAGTGNVVAVVSSDEGLLAVSSTESVTLTGVDQELVFNFSDSTIPADAPGLFLTVVYRGPLGLEDDAVIAGGTPLEPITVSDDFNRAISGFTNTVGLLWDETNDNTGADFSLRANGDPTVSRLQIVAEGRTGFPGDSLGYIFWNRPFKDNQSSEAKFVKDTIGNERFIIGVGIRMSGTVSSFTGYIAVLEREVFLGPKFFRLYRCVNHNMNNGATGRIQLATTSVSLPGVGDTIRISGEGGEIMVDVNGQTRFLVRDEIFNPITGELEPIIKSGKPGFVSLVNYSGRGGAASLQFDDWTGSGIDRDGGQIFTLDPT